MQEKVNTVKAHMDWLLERQNRILVAIEGKCTSGKTTLAAELSKIYDCNVLHMDDFFLQSHQRTPERFAETGGNVDYERFQEEVLLPLKAGKAFSYRPFDCKSFTLSQPVPVQPKRVNIIEGSYSLHPLFGNPYDLKILLTVSEEVQRRRVLERPAFLHQRFFEFWIPMENRYLEQSGIEADIIL